VQERIGMPPLSFAPDATTGEVIETVQQPYENLRSCIICGMSFAEDSTSNCCGRDDVSEGNRSKIVLALAGGNALGAYAAGAYEAMHARGYLPHVIAGASIGAVNGAIIAGNPPEQRVKKLRAFWEQAALGSAPGVAPASGRPREWYNSAHTLQTLLMGRPGLFRPRLPGLMSVLPWMPPDVAIFDNRPLLDTLSASIDFDWLNSAHVPLIITAVDMENGQPVFFDSRKQKIEGRHFLASTALAPAFPPVDVDGRCLGDPGLIANLPIDPLLDPPPQEDMLCFAVDLFEARGARPTSLDSGLERAQDIAFSSQALRTIEAHAREHRLRHMIGALPAQAAAELRAQGGMPAAELLEAARHNTIEVLLVAYRARQPELATKTLEFSRASVRERWEAGRLDMERAIDKLQLSKPTSRDHGFVFHDGRRPAAEG
jgi:NTE family protein